MSDHDDEIDHATLFDITHTKLESWESKDRKVATVRIADKNGLCDFKIYLMLQAKVHQMGINLGVMLDDESGTEH